MPAKAIDLKLLPHLYDIKKKALFYQCFFIFYKIMVL